jgi:hypothetical protein
MMTKGKLEVFQLWVKEWQSCHQVLESGVMKNFPLANILISDSSLWNLEQMS